MKRCRNHDTFYNKRSNHYVENDREWKTCSGHGRDQTKTKGHVKALQECGVQPLTQYSTVGASTLQGKIIILLGLEVISDSVFSVLVVILILDGVCTGMSAVDMPIRC